MPVHDWTRVEAGVFHDFHHAWIEDLKRALNGGVLPEQYYALAEQHAAGFGPDILPLQASTGEDADEDTNEVPEAGKSDGGGALLLSQPSVQVTAETSPRPRSTTTHAARTRTESTARSGRRSAAASTFPRPTSG